LPLGVPVGMYYLQPVLSEPKLDGIDAESGRDGLGRGDFCASSCLRFDRKLNSGRLLLGLQSRRRSLSVDARGILLFCVSGMVGHPYLVFFHLRRRGNGDFLFGKGKFTEGSRWV
jgi:hypothetical protein